MQHSRPHASRLAGARPRRPARGFTLIELVITVSLVGVLLSIGVPALQRQMTGRGVIAQADELAATLRSARSDALRLNRQVSVCASANTTAATPTCSDSTAWGTGWVTFIDDDNNGSRAATGERLLRVQSPLASVNGIVGTAVSVRFFPNGLVATGQASFNVQPKLATTDNNYSTLQRRVCLYSPGRTAVIPGTGAC